MTNEIETHVNKLASQVIPPDHLDSFIVLDLNDKLIGIAVFAALGGDTKIQKAAEALIGNEVK